MVAKNKRLDSLKEATRKILSYSNQLIKTYAFLKSEKWEEPRKFTWVKIVVTRTFYTRLVTIGLQHEHTRPDANEFLKFNFETINPQYLNNFKTWNAEKLTRILASTFMVMVTMTPTQ